MSTGAEAVPGDDGAPEMKLVRRNINALLERNKQSERERTWQDRIADTITAFTGSMLFVFIHLALFGIWIIWNLGWLGLKPFDESFVVLAMFASVEAIFLSTFVLISQNRSNEEADKRAELNLQVNLLAEHEITRLIQLTSAIARKLDIPESYDEEIEVLAKDVRPEQVLDTLERHKEEIQKNAD
jgi:uncharacterized membrane protein